MVHADDPGGMPLDRRGLLESAGAGLVGGYALTKLVPSIWFRVDAVRHAYPVRVSNATDRPYDVRVRAFRGGPGGETLVLDRDLTVESTVSDRGVERRTVAVLRGTHRVVVRYADREVELFTASDAGSCAVEIRAPDDGDRPEPAGVYCGV